MNSEPMCCVCFDECELVDAPCDEKPELVNGAIGMYHCPDCGAMVLAGYPHMPVCRPCAERIKRTIGS